MHGTYQRIRRIARIAIKHFAEYGYAIGRFPVVAVSQAKSAHPARIGLQFALSRTNSRSGQAIWQVHGPFGVQIEEKSGSPVAIGLKRKIIQLRSRLWPIWLLAGAVFDRMPRDCFFSFLASRSLRTLRMTASSLIDKGFELARERYAELGVDAQRC